MRDHLDFAKAKFDEEIEEGLMEKMSPETFKALRGEHSDSRSGGDSRGQEAANP